MRTIHVGWGDWIHIDGESEFGNCDQLEIDCGWGLEHLPGKSCTELPGHEEYRLHQ